MASLRWRLSKTKNVIRVVTNLNFTLHTLAIVKSETHIKAVRNPILILKNWRVFILYLAQNKNPPQIGGMNR